MLQTELSTSASTTYCAHLSRLPSRFSLIEPDSDLRAQIEEKIRRGYGRHFGACITNFMPSFACYEHENGTKGVIGFRRAADERLFLENYLTRPIEATIHEAARRPVPREAIVEVGQFVVDEPGIVADLFRDLVPFLIGRGFQWVCFTGTHKIRAILRRIGFHGMPVGCGVATAAPAGGGDWGSYYENEPVVIVGKLSDPAGYWCGDEDVQMPAWAPGA